MHDNDTRVSSETVSVILSIHYPKLSGLQIHLLSDIGTDHYIYKIGDDYVGRFPRNAHSSKSIEKEYIFGQKLGSRLEYINPPLFIGKESLDYPHKWTLSKYIVGNTPDFHKSQSESLAVDLAGFINQLHKIEIKNAPRARRGVSINTMNLQTIEAIQQINEYSQKELMNLWQQLVNQPSWGKAPVWVHGDLLPGNIILDLKGRLKSIIDLSEIGVGDPACDLIIAWSLFDEKLREKFKSNLHIDDATWLRGKAWALSIAAIMMPYYRTRNKYIYQLSKRMIDNVLHSVF